MSEMRRTGIPASITLAQGMIESDYGRSRLAVEANKLKPRVNKEELKSKLDEIVPLNSTLDGNDLVVYQLDEKNGTIEKLKEYKGLPSDENYLNEGLAESNDEFSKLLDLEDLCQ